MLLKYPVYEARKDQDVYEDDVWIPDGTCEDNFGFDSYGNDCSIYYFSRPCGFADSFDFKASEECCACGGGTHSSSSSDHEDDFLPSFKPEKEAEPEDDDKGFNPFRWFGKDDDEEEGEDKRFNLFGSWRKSSE